MMIHSRILLIASMLISAALAFQNRLPGSTTRTSSGIFQPVKIAAQVSQAEAQKGIDKVVNALRKDSAAIKELGRLEKVTVVLGYGSPDEGTLNVRFNASFKKLGKGMSATPMPFMLGQTDRAEGRGTMVGQVKASVDTKTGKVSSCSVFKDLGYGKSFMMKV
jgi:hypothetical protein